MLHSGHLFFSQRNVILRFWSLDQLPIFYILCFQPHEICPRAPLMWIFFFFASVTSPGTASFFLSQPQSSLLWISAHSLSSFTCVASLLNDCMSTPHDRHFFYHSTCFVSLLHFPFGWAVWWLVLLKCDMGLPLGKKEAMNDTHSAVCVVKLMIRHAVMYVCYFCSDLWTEAGSQVCALHDYAVKSSGSWNLNCVLGHCYIINCDTWNLCT